MVTDQAHRMGFAGDRDIRDMHEEASRRTGLADFGPEDYRRPLAMLASHLGDEGFSVIGRESFREDLIIALVGRLVREDAWKRHPEYAHQTIERPLVICGIPRTGTTALHKLLSVDPQFQGLDNWITSWPIPRPPRAEWAGVPGFRAAQERLERLFELVPQLRVSHEMVADEVDECLQVLRLDFVSYFYAATYDLPDYEAWFQQQDELPFYRRLADTLRLIGLRDDRTWLLKNPGHIGQLEALLGSLPDARVIITHRDPVKTIPSLCSVLSGGRRMAYENPDLARLGPGDLGFWGCANERAKAFRQRAPSDQFLDVQHEDFNREPMATVRRIYTHFGIELSPATERRMQDWLAANPSNKHGDHRYELSDYGLDERQIREALGNG